MTTRPLSADLIRGAEILEREAKAIINCASPIACHRRGDIDDHDEMLRLAHRLRRAGGKQERTK